MLPSMRWPWRFPSGARQRCARLRPFRRPSPTWWRSSFVRAGSRAWRSASSSASRKQNGQGHQTGERREGTDDRHRDERQQRLHDGHEPFGMAKRTVRDSASMSLVVRLSRSPVPARSTSTNGRPNTLSRNSRATARRRSRPRGNYGVERGRKARRRGSTRQRGSRRRA